MRSLMFLYAFCLFAIAQGKLYYQDKIKNYYMCWTYMNCISDGQMAREMKNCLDFLKQNVNLLRVFQNSFSSANYF
ncbi:hypothetical protein AVEN_274860-1 [Araneus ventricosus]|uniref:Uncharacterized protein n=1 Tax=Araneus ventricosus TaxID=182803 RepID=A0A4Y2IAH2_ARAVE|nr:hypothetical protein AVEN_274860-1 [Araneus ventricosus]